MWKPARARNKLPVLVAVGIASFISLLWFYGGSESLRTLGSVLLSEAESASKTAGNSPNDLPDPNIRLPSLLPQYVIEEAALPQHDTNLPTPEGKHAKFIRFGNQFYGVGFNNQLTEILLLSYVAYEAGRSYAFTPIQWDVYSPKPYIFESSEKGHLAGNATVRVNRIPLRGFLDSPTAGSPYPPISVAEERDANGTVITPAGSKPDPVPRAVSDKWYDKMCPTEERLQINGSKVNEYLQFHMKGGVGAISHWISYLRTLPSQCVNLQWATDRVVDFGLIASEHILGLWPIVSKSPVYKSFKWSPLVLGAVERNLPALSPSSSRIQGEPYPANSSVIPNLITVHLRRRDFQEHCRYMASWGTFFGWCALPELPDPYRPEGDRATYTLSRCWIEKETVIDRLNTFREFYEQEHNIILRNVYMATNAREDWLDDLKQALHANGWEKTLTWNDLEIEWDERTVDNAIDMEIAARGEVFIGNGFSSVSSTVVMLRMLRGLAPITTRMW